MSTENPVDQSLLSCSLLREMRSKLISENFNLEGLSVNVKPVTSAARLIGCNSLFLHSWEGKKIPTLYVVEKGPLQIHALVYG